jgi:hypothetical protein
MILMWIINTNHDFITREKQQIKQFI